MRILGVIPSRYNSTRFPGKPLVDIKGKSMIRRVYEQASKSQALEKVVVATDDQRIFDEVVSFGGQVMMTSESHKNGTERTSEVAERLTGYDYVINIQGDEPFVHPDQLDLLAKQLDGQTQIATLVKAITHEAVLDDPNEIKVVFNRNSEALYFSRACIPYSRASQNNRLQHHNYYKHIGLYAYQTDVLKQLSKQKPTNCETAESLEQLRWMEHGFQIKIELTTLDSQMIDTREDLMKIDQYLNSTS
ncbi:MAG: 3-deoxy-manno-octulosonate cytidylyltransferase [Cyclobacteriaceae bacterium]